MEKEQTYWQKYYQDHKTARIAAACEWQQKHKAERKAYMREYTKRNPSKFRRTREQQDDYNARRRDKYASDPEYREAHKASVKDWQEKNAAKRFAQRLKPFGISPYEYQEIMDRQGGKCAICGTTDPGDKRSRRFHLDHCHDTGVVRGLLCASCNLGIGKFFDNPDTLERAAMYLRRHQQAAD